MQQQATQIMYTEVVIGSLHQQKGLSCSVDVAGQNDSRLAPSFSAAFLTHNMGQGSLWSSS